MRTRPLLLVALLSAFGASEAANILCLVYFVAPSHFVMFERLFKELTGRGHNLTVVSHFPQKTPVANYTDISILGSIPPLEDEVTMEVVDEYQSQSMAAINWQANTDYCKSVLSLPQLRALRDSGGRYDLVIAEVFHGDCLVPFAHVFGAPLVGIVSSVAFPWVHDRVGNPDHPAYSEGYYPAMTAPFSFWERLENCAWHAALRLGNWWLSQRPIDALARQFFGPGVPVASSVARNSSLVLVNSHHSVNEPRPTVPAFVEVGGLHIKEVKPLPQVLQQFLDGSARGAVFFSLGTMVRCDTFSPDKMAALLAVFSALPQRVLWRADPAKLPPLPPNVLARKWMPQNDVLNHPNVRLFITHSGLMGTQEALWAGVPMLCMPMFGDQFLNALNVESLGAGIKLEYKDITNQSLAAAMDALLNNPRNGEKQFDMVIVHALLVDCFDPFAHLLGGVPLVAVSTSLMTPWCSDRVANPHNPAYVGTYFLSYETGHLGFYERFLNTFYHLFMKLVRYRSLHADTEALHRRHLGAQLPPLQQSVSATSLVLVNTHWTLNGAVPLLPNVVEVGGLHIEEPRPLSQDLEQFLSGSGEGVVYVSFGSLIPFHTLPLEKMRAVLEALSGLEQRVLLRCDATRLPPEVRLPSNVRASRWLPQAAILAHGSVRAFVSHGGMHSALEAVQFGVPLLGVPLFIDQRLTISRLQTLGVAVQQDYLHMTAQSFSAALHSLVNDTRYRERAQHLSALFRDRPRSPLEEAVYWVEYVIRHQGAPHLRSAAMDLAWYQYLLLDVAAFVIAVASAVVVLAYYMTCTVLRLLKPANSSKQAKETRKKRQ